jgi:hypothetical protein
LMSKFYKKPYYCKALIELIKSTMPKIIFAILLAILGLLSSCQSDPSLYDRAGFDPGSVPPQEPNLDGQNRVAPDYYYRQQTPNSYPPQQGNYQYQNQQYQQQGGYPPQNQQQYGSPYQVYPTQGGSRYYSNPYAIPPSSYYPQYDADQYYVPPAYYGAEAQPNSMQKPQGGRAY